jgi:hypothetical protein
MTLNPLERFRKKKIPMIMPNDNKIGEIGDIRFKKYIRFTLVLLLMLVYFPITPDGEILSKF